MNTIENNGAVSEEKSFDGHTEKHFYPIFDNMQEGVVINKLLYDKNGVPVDYLILDVNPQFERILNVNKKNIISKPSTEIYNTTEAPYLDIFANVIKNNTPVEFETYFSALKKYFRMAVSPVEGGVFVTVFTDVTEKKDLMNELKKALEKSEESNRLKSSLLSNLSHEFRTPMTGILGMSSILKDKLKDPENLTILDYIISSGNRLMKTLNAILELAEDESNIKNLKLIHLSSLAEPVIVEFMAKAENKGLGFKCDINDGTLSIYSNERVLSQVFVHLLDNAVKFTEHGFVEISINSEVIDGTLWAKIAIKDTGIGILPKDQEPIFNEFRQVSEGISRSFEGVGLGLTLVKKMVTLMKGKIVLESSVGAGSLFTIYLPAEKIEFRKNLQDFKVVSSPKVEKNKKLSEKPRILLVEDNLINVKVTQVYLKENYMLDYARTGLQAVKLANENQYSMILMDINLGVGMDGVKTAKAIKEINGYEKTPIVALTGYAMESDKEKLFAEGLTHHLSKPFDRATLTDFVEYVLAEADSVE